MHEQASSSDKSPITHLWDELEVKRIHEDIEVTDFVCKTDPLNDFLYNDAHIGCQHFVSVTHLVFYNGVLVGFFTLTNDVIKKGKLLVLHRKPNYHHHYPALKIARLATHKSHESKGVGTFMIYQAVGIAATISRYTGCKFITVDAKVESAEWYVKRGFVGVDPVEKWSKDPEDTIPLYLDYCAIFDRYAEGTPEQTQEAAQQ